MEIFGEPLRRPAADLRSDQANESVFTLVEPLRRTAPVVFASPHSGRRYPPDLLAATQLPLASLRRSEDAYVDELFAGVAAHGATLLAANVARAYVDLNRDPGELDADMFHDAPPAWRHSATARVLAGLGAIPRISGEGEDIYRRRLPISEAERRIATVHRPYHAMLSALVEEAKSQFGAAIVIDCHSMPSAARGLGGPDIVLGDRFGSACNPLVTRLVEQLLTRLGYRVARNAPFAGGYTTQAFGRPHQSVHALQIELSRSLYLQERSLTRSAGFGRVRADMARVAAHLAAANLHSVLA